MYKMVLTDETEFIVLELGCIFSRDDVKLKKEQDYVSVISVPPSQPNQSPEMPADVPLPS